MARVGIEILKDELEKGRVAPEVWVRFPRQLGDVIFAIPFFGSLQKSWDEAAAALGVKLRWIAVGHAIGAAVFSEAHPDFIAESVIEQGGVGKPDPWMLLRRWRERRPVAVLNLSQSVRLTLAAWMARVPIRGGIADNHLGALYTHPFRYRDLPIHLTERYEPLLELLTGQRTQAWVPLTPDRMGGARGPELLREAGWDGRPYVALAFGTRGYSKRWFPERDRWPALARMLMAEGYAAVWLGGPDEVALGGELAAAAPGSLDLTGRTTIPEACAIQYGAYGNVAIDTGLAHTAAGTGRPTVTLMGGSSEMLISPQGPCAVTLRGPAMDTEPGLAGQADPCGSSSHRIAPGRVARILHALAAERG